MLINWVVGVDLAQGKIHIRQQLADAVLPGSRPHNITKQQEPGWARLLLGFHMGKKQSATRPL